MTASMNESFFSQQERLIADLRHQNAQLMERNAELRRRLSRYEAHMDFGFGAQGAQRNG